MSDEERMPDDLDPRMLKAMKKALIAAAPPMPADLKAELMRLARERAPRRSWFDVLRESLSVRPWAYGAGAAFAAAGVVLAVRLSLHESPAQVPLVGPQALVEVAQPAELTELWDADDGGDADEG